MFIWGIKWYLIVFLITIFLFITEDDHYFIFIGYLCFFSSDMHLHIIYPFFLFGCYLVLLLFRNSVYDTIPSSFIFVKSIFPQLVVCLIAPGLNSDRFYFHRVMPYNSILPPHINMILPFVTMNSDKHILFLIYRVLNISSYSFSCNYQYKPIWILDRVMNLVYNYAKIKS